VDEAGNVWVGGQTTSTGFPTTPDANDTSYNSGDDIFLAQLTPNGSALLYSTFLGGSGNDNLRAMALDGAGNVWIAGSTTSGNLPTTLNALNDTHNGGTTDVFLAQLAANGSILLYSSYLGGSGNDGARDLAFDATGNVWVTATTSSANFPTTTDALNATHNGGTYDVFLALVAANGSVLLYSTYLGGSGNELGWDLALDAVDNVWVAGYTESGDFPTTADALNTTANGGREVFLALLAANGSDLLYSTYLGGSNDDDALSLALDGAGNVWFTGYTYAGTPNFPTTPDALNTTYNGGTYDAYVAQLAANGSALLYSTFLGGTGDDEGGMLALNGAGNVWVLGSTSSEFPTTSDAVNTTNPGGLDAFVAQIAADGSALLYSTYLGGDATDRGHALAVNAVGNVWIAGYTEDHATTDFPTSPAAFDPTHNGGDDAFVCALMPPSSPQALSAEFNDVNTVTLTWSAPTTPGSAPITTYRVYRSTTSSVIGVLVAETLTTNYTDISSLDPEIPYYYVVTAVSSIGESTASNEVSIGLIVPSSPQSLAATAGSGHTILLVWSAPIPNCGPSITAYRVYRSTIYGLIGTFLANTTTTAFNDSTVVLGVEYSYVVTAVNRIGESSPSNQFRIVFTAPSAPQQLSITAGSEHTAILTWTAPATEGSTSLIAYRVYRSTNSSVYGDFLAETFDTTFTDTSLDSGVSYYFVVTAVNSNGESPMSNEAAIILSATVPGAPGNLSAVPGVNFVVLSWLPSATDGGSPIISYRVYRDTSSGNYLFLGGSTSTTFNDTTAVGGLTYYYAVRAVNRIGESSYSNEVSVAPLILPITTNGSESTTATTPGFLTIVILLSLSGIWLWRRKEP
jgi:fibronectin type 3 domain-containing protein